VKVGAVGTIIQRVSQNYVSCNLRLRFEGKISDRQVGNMLCSVM